MSTGARIQRNQRFGKVHDPIVVLHVGYPKTGSTAFQSWCDSNRSWLKEHGVCYPACDPPGSSRAHQYERSHKFLVNELRANRFEALPWVIKRNTLPGLLLSAEGLSVDLPLYSAKALAALRKHLDGHKIVVFLVARELHSWVRSAYKQCIVNPKTPGRPWATALTLEEFFRSPIVSQMRSVLENPSKLAEAYGADELVVASYNESWWQNLFDVFNIQLKENLQQQHKANVSLDDHAIEIIRRINEQDLPDIIRNDAMFILGKYSFRDSMTLRNFYKRSPEFTQHHSNILDALKRAEAGKIITGQSEAGIKLEVSAK